MKKNRIFFLVFFLLVILNRVDSQPNDCSGPGSEVHDDGTFENGYTLTGDSVRFIMKITPSNYPWTYNKICIGWTRFAGAPENLSYDIMVYHVMSDGRPEYVFKEYLGEQVNSISIFPEVKWNSTIISLPPLVAGSYYIGVRYMNNPGSDIFIASDESPLTPKVPAYVTNQPDYYFHWMKADSQWTNYRSLAIRMSGEPGIDPFSCISPVGSEIHDDGTIEAFAFGTYDSTRIVQKLQPPQYPWKYKKVCIAWSKLYFVPADYIINYEVIVYDDSGPGGRPGNLVALIPGQKVIKVPSIPNYKWNSTELNIPDLNSGSYYIGVRSNNSNYIGVGIAMDTSLTTPVWEGYHYDPTLIWERNNLEWRVCRSFAIRTEGSPLIGVIQINNQIPEKYKLEQNYPNPFNPQTKINFELPKASFTKLNIYDINGRQVSTLINANLMPGTYEADWDGSNYSSGIYFYKFEAGDYIETKKMVLLK